MMKKIGLLFFMSCSWMIPSSYRAHLSEAWYSSRSKVLRSALQDLQNKAAQKYLCHLNSSEIKALLVPHAGYDYSGVVATSAYQNITSGYFKRVIILAPSHHLPVQGVALPGFEYDSFKNIVGKVFLDVEMLHALQHDHPELFQYYHRAHEIEHSIEIQIPLIQKYCGTCAIVPLLIGSVTPLEMQVIAHALQQYLDDTTLVIASSDLTHYGLSFGYTPFVSGVGRQIVALDDQLVQKIQNLDDVGFMVVKQTTGAMVCGAQSIALLLKLLQVNGNVMESYVTGYDCSSHAENPEHSVSYVGMVFSTQKRTTLPLSDQLTGYEKGVLHELVQAELYAVFKNSMQGVISGVLTKALRAYQGVFITFYNSEHVLRGCVGTVSPEGPLYQVACRTARAAAVDDLRLQSVTLKELTDITYAISVLTKPQKILSYHDIRVGIDGVVLKCDRRSALFLPNVALEFGWDLATMLQQLSIKAGLTSDAYKQSKAQFEIFQTIEI